jgi:hypothetical protein
MRQFWLETSASTIHMFWGRLETRLDETAIADAVLIATPPAPACPQLRSHHSGRQRRLPGKNHALQSRPCPSHQCAGRIESRGSGGRPVCKREGHHTCARILYTGAAWDHHRRSRSSFITTDHTADGKGQFRLTVIWKTSVGKSSRAKLLLTI